MLNILVTEPETYSQLALERLRSIGKVETKKVSRNRLFSLIQDFDILMVALRTRIDRQLITRAKRLKVIATPTTGLDHIDVRFAERMGVKIISLKGETKFLENVNSTAEHTFALLLSLARKMPAALESVKRNRWKREEFIGTELNGKTIGIIGLGRLGSKVCRLAREFGMTVLAYDPHLTLKKVRDLGATPAPLNDLLANCDVISIHASLTEETEGMITYEQFRLMKKTALIVNTARGKIIDEQALLYALNNRMIAGAALDVLSTEDDFDMAAHNPLVEYAKENGNLLITPHVGGATRESMEATQTFIAEKVVNHAKSRGWV